MNKPMHARVCAALVLIAVIATSSSAAQRAGSELQGTIVSGSGAPVIGVTVTITNLATRSASETITDRDGRFTIAGLLPGVYEVQASHHAYATGRQSPVPLEAGQVITLRLELASAPDPETITLGEPSPMIEHTRSHASSLVDRTAIEHLPVRGRTALELAPLAAGSARECDGFAPTFDCAGRNRVIVDGADRTGTIAAAGAVSVEAVRSINVKTLASPAEYGRASGALALVATKSGSNHVAGSAFAHYGIPRENYSLGNVGASLGGPLVGSRHFGFGVYDRWREDVPATPFLNLPPGTPSDAATRAAMDRLSQFAGPWERGVERDEILARTDHQLFDRQRLTLRYHHHRAADEETGRFRTLTSRDAAAVVDRRARALSATATAEIGSTIFNEARVQIARDRDRAAANGNGPSATIREQGTEVFSIGSSPFAPRESAVGRLQLGDTLTVVRGTHTLKAGVDLLLDDVESARPGNFAGAYSFNTLAGFDRGVPAAVGDVYTQAFDRSGTSGRRTRLDVRDYALFAQDEWRAAEDVTIDLGLRYDLQAFAGEGGDLPDTDTNNLAPRLGVAWTPLAAPLVVRAGYATTYGRSPWTMAAAARGYNGGNVQTVTRHGAEGDAVPRFPARFAAAPPDASAPVVLFDIAFESAATHQASVGLDWEWMPNTALAVSYLFARGRGLPRAIEIGGGARRVVALQSVAESRYDGIAIELMRRFSQGHQYRVSYTLGRAQDTMPLATAIALETDADAAIVPAGAATPDATRGPADHDRRHRLVGTMVYDSNRLAERYNGFLRALFSNWMASGVCTVQSGLPYSARVAGDLNGDGNRFNDLAPGTTRNEQRREAYMSADLRLARDIRLGRRTKATLIGEVFNVLNQANYLDVNDTFFAVPGREQDRNPLFGESLDPADPRRMRLAVRFSF